MQESGKRERESGEGFKLGGAAGGQILRDADGNRTGSAEGLTWPMFTRL
jgi:hypothetical protein